MQYVKITKARRAEKVTKGERWAAERLEAYYMAKSYSFPLDESGVTVSDGGREWIEVWEKALDTLPKDEAMAARLIHCERLDARQAAEVMRIPRIKAAALASRACQRLAAYFGRGVNAEEVEKGARITGARIKRSLSRFCDIII